MKAYFIDAEKHTVTEFEIAPNDYGAIGRMIGCDMIEIACVWEGGDVLFVDEEFLGKPIAHWFQAQGNPQPLGGHGVVTGPDRHKMVKGEFIEWTDDVQCTAADVLARIRFMTRAQVDSWGKAHASDEGASITTVHPIARHGPAVEVRAVITTMGQLYASVPPVKED